METKTSSWKIKWLAVFHLGASEILGVIWGDAGFTLVSVCPADSNNLYEYFVAGTFSTKSNFCGLFSLTAEKEHTVELLR